MKTETTGKLKAGGWGLVLGAVIAIVIGFAWGGWSTPSMTKAMAAEAVLASQAAICVAQFTKQPNYDETLKEFEKVTSWERAKFIKKGGWDKMTGQTESDYAVSRACADGIGLLIEK